MFKSCLYPILDYETCSKKVENLLDTISMWNQFNISHYQFRAKGLGFNEYLQISHILKSQKSKFTIIANDFIQALDHPDIFSGIHLGQDDYNCLSKKDKERLGCSAKNIVLGYSTNNKIEVKNRLNLVRQNDYIAMGPIFPTKSKKDARKVITAKGLADMLELVSNSGIRSIVLIGGIQFDRLIDLKNSIIGYLKSPQKFNFSISGISMFQNANEIIKTKRMLKDWELTF